MASSRPFSEILSGWWNFESFNPTFRNFVGAWNHSTAPMSEGLPNSFTVAIPSSIIPILVASLAGYGFARFSFPLRDLLFLTIVLLMSIPGQMIAIPVFLMMARLHLVDRPPMDNPIYEEILFRFSNEVEEAARIDGASDLQIFFYKIVLPMTLPALASVVVLQFMQVWNDFFFAQILIYDTKRMLVTQRIPLMGGKYVGTDWGVLSAASVLTLSVPVIIYAFLQKYYVKGVIGGAVKG